MGKLIDMNGTPIGDTAEVKSDVHVEHEETGNLLVHNFMRAVQVSAQDAGEPVTFIAEVMDEQGNGGSFAVTVSFFPQHTAKQAAEKIGAVEEKMDA